MSNAPVKINIVEVSDTTGDHCVWLSTNCDLRWTGGIDQVAVDESQRQMDVETE